MLRCLCCSLSGLLLLAACGPVAAEAGKSPPRSRTFRFTYAATVTGLKPGQKARIWLPVPPSNLAQDVTLLNADLPAKGRPGKEKQYGNRLMYVEARANREGKVPLRVVYRVTRREEKAEKGSMEDAARLARFLEPDALVPIDGKPLRLIEGKKLPRDPEARARVLYDLVDRHMRYDKTGTGWGRGDAVWACDAKHGNCSDFHSLFISLARSQKIPAKFVIGFPLPEKHGKGIIPGYHCWAYFKPAADKGWVPVDISEANKNPKLRDYYFGNLTPDRIAFSIGRDITLVPRQAGKPLNFFIYPYVEVAGKPWPQEKIETRFSFQDLRREE
jgi:transglutaminase-like putative cysteine protease